MSRSQYTYYEILFFLGGGGQNLAKVDCVICAGSLNWKWNKHNIFAEVVWVKQRYIDLRGFQKVRNSCQQFPNFQISHIGYLKFIISTAMTNKVSQIKVFLNSSFKYLGIFKINGVSNFLLFPMFVFLIFVVVKWG